MLTTRQSHERATCDRTRHAPYGGDAHGGRYSRRAGAAIAPFGRGVAKISFHD